MLSFVVIISYTREPHSDTKKRDVQLVNKFISWLCWKNCLAKFGISGTTTLP